MATPPPPPEQPVQPIALPERYIYVRLSRRHARCLLGVVLMLAALCLAGLIGYCIGHSRSHIRWTRPCVQIGVPEQHSHFCVQPGIKITPGGPLVPATPGQLPGGGRINPGGTMIPAQPQPNTTP